MMTKYPTPATAGAEADRRVQVYLSEHQGVSYKEALHAVLAADKQLAAAYGQPAARVGTPPAVHLPPPVPLAQGKTPGETVHLRTVALMDLVPSLNYQAAVNQVLAADPALKAAYART